MIHLRIFSYNRAQKKSLVLKGNRGRRRKGEGGGSTKSFSPLYRISSPRIKQKEKEKRKRRKKREGQMNTSSNYRTLKEGGGGGGAGNRGKGSGQRWRTSATLVG